MLRNLLLIMMFIGSSSFMLPIKLYKYSKRLIIMNNNYDDYIVKGLQYTVYDPKIVLREKELLDYIYYICNETNITSK